MLRGSVTGEIGMTLRRLLRRLRRQSPVLLAVTGCNEPEPGTVKDEALRADPHAPTASPPPTKIISMTWTAATSALKFDAHEVNGRNTWIVWTGGNDRFWDYMANNTFGAFDLLKIMSSNPRIGFCIGPDKKAQ